VPSLDKHVRIRRAGPCRGFRAATFRQAGTSPHAGADGLRQASFHQMGQNLCAPAGACVQVVFTGPYQSTVPGAGATVFTVFDLKFADLTHFTPGNGMFFFASFTFQSPAGWTAGKHGFASLYFGGNPAPIGTASPPNPFSDINSGPDGGGFNVLFQDPGPANATTTVTLGPFPFPLGTVPAVPGNHVPLKLVLGSSTNPYTTRVLAATFKTCDHVFT
jgi:hypothetical protein